MLNGEFARICLKYRAEAEMHGAGYFVGYCQTEGDWIVVTQESRVAVRVPMSNVAAVVLLKDGQDDDMRQMNEKAMLDWTRETGAVGGRG